MKDHLVRHDNRRLHQGLSIAVSLLVLIFAGWPPSSHARPPVSPFPGAQGVGGGLSGSAFGVPALYVNPAGMGRVPVYSLEGSFLYLADGKDMGYSDSSFHLAVVDAQTQLLAAGIGYSYLPGGDLGDHDLRIGIAYPLTPRMLFLGVSGSYRFGAGDVLDDNLTVDVGLMASADRASAGLVLRNAFDAPQRGAFRQLGVGMGIETRVRVSGDVLYGFGQDDSWEANLGGQYTFADSFPVRLGYSWQSRQNLLSGGFAIASPMGEIGFTYRQNLNELSERLLLAGLQFYL